MNAQKAESVVWGAVSALLTKPERTQRHQEVRWRKVKGHSKTGGAHKAGNDRADELAVAAKKEAAGERGVLSRPGERDAPIKLAGEAARQ